MAKKSGIYGRIKVGGTSGVFLKAKSFEFSDEVDVHDTTHFESGGQQALARGVQRLNGTFEMDADTTQDIRAAETNLVTGNTVEAEFYELGTEEPHAGFIFIVGVRRRQMISGVANYVVTWRSNSDDGPFTVGGGPATP